MKKAASYITQQQLVNFERKLWLAIFGDEGNPDGYDVVEDKLIFEKGQVNRQETKEGVFFFNVPLIIGQLNDETYDVRMYQYLEQNPKTGSRWGKLSAQGFKIMWRINVELTPNVFEMRYSNVPDARTRQPEGRVDLKAEKIQQMVNQAPTGSRGRVLR
ncbi:MAG: hypothetical protein KAS36_07825 [Anaerolineales bacterium]|nr:hypothetical protein [Anaerolineales bacterium]